MKKNGAPWHELQIEGDLYVDLLQRLLYSTDASEFQEMPAAVACPKHSEDIRRLLEFARKHRLGLIPRGAGTSLAGQVVGSGIVVDLRRYMNGILSIDPAGRRARVQPGVIRYDLNTVLRPHGLFFAPETSTADRATIGGMVGNNSCGANSIVYGSTRDRLVRARGFLADGSEVEFGPLDPSEFSKKCEASSDSLEAQIYRHLRNVLGNPYLQHLIREHFPKPEVQRRNTGYALDSLLNSQVFDPSSDKPFNLCQLIAGSEGTLFIGTEFELALDPIPYSPALLCAHFSEISEALQAAGIVMRASPSAVELLDRHVLSAAAAAPDYGRNRFFIEGDPAAILAVEVRRSEPEESLAALRSLAVALKEKGLGYAHPIFNGADVERIWSIRRAGQALIMNTPGDVKPAEVIEDTAVAVEDLPAYFRDFDAIVRGKYGLDCVYYGHVGAGEIHARPYLNLRSEEGKRMFRALAADIAGLVKKYRGSLSGEHGDGRLRGEFLRLFFGDDVYELLRGIKRCFDPFGILNPGKIIDAPPMIVAHRHRSGERRPEFDTLFDFGSDGGLIRAAERCNGAGVCLRSHRSGGTMCPSFMATRNEPDSTRGRANTLRILLSAPPDPRRPFSSKDLLSVLDLCLSCKACKSECPTGVDMAKLKAEVLQQHYDETHTPFSAWIVANFASFARFGARQPAIWNAILRSKTLRGLCGFDTRRKLPPMPPASVLRQFDRLPSRPIRRHRTVAFFIDEFTRYQDPSPGLASIELLERLGYEVIRAPLAESGRAAISKGMLRRARNLVEKNLSAWAPFDSEGIPLLGAEPSALLTLRDEYPQLVRGEAQRAAARLSERVRLIDEFLAEELDLGRLDRTLFRPLQQTVHLHVHCHQKALSSPTVTFRLLRELAGADVRLIPAGCCGMAGSFGYERDHYNLSMQIGELVLFPYIRQVPESDRIAATGTSCRHQIRDGTGRIAVHPVELLLESLPASASPERL
ncbi:MAG: FAD-binding protein [Kiritimatiellae bacterium]|nr:FAD-binding protein [Kiritimatiellia bacterium]MDW8457483.1 FAD-linked oxidase C-terminal domain-containing protein [Verrucomicrobiota bacterium]